MVEKPFVAEAQDYRVYWRSGLMAPMLDSCATCKHFIDNGETCEKAVSNVSGERTTYIQVVCWRCPAYERQDQSVIQ